MAAITSPTDTAWTQTGLLPVSFPTTEEEMNPSFWARPLRYFRALAAAAIISRARSGDAARSSIL
ncbi:MAG: hypothetical protein BWY77_01379 [bacterium ADurb.Bin431]|nr:MAG: hypothetical protein BWY77_01379 [bacterium ADurb.Bin431]